MRAIELLVRTTSFKVSKLATTSPERATSAVISLRLAMRCSPRRARSSSGYSSSTVMAVRKPSPPRLTGNRGISRRPMARAAEGAPHWGIQLTPRDGGEEPRPAEIDGKQGNLAPPDGAGRREQRAIAAQHDHQVAGFHHLLARQAGDTPGVDAGLLVDAHRDAAVAQPFDQLGYQAAGGGRGRLGNDADGLYDGHRGETPCSLRRRRWGSRR